MTITDSVIKNIIRKLILGQDYRIEVVTLLDVKFLDYAIEFFKRIAEAKLKNKNITIDWYKKEMLDNGLPKKEIHIHSGLNEKTIKNMHNTTRKTVVIEASNEHYDELYQAIRDLVENNDVIDITLTIKFNKVSIDLTINESLIVINSLAVKRAEISGGLWSSAGKQTEKKLIQTLCKIYEVPRKYYEEVYVGDSFREVDFYLLGKNNKKLRCEVKLMGMGNPESADVVFARESQIFVADKLSDKNKKQLTDWGIEWIELRNNEGCRDFFKLLKKNKIPCEDFEGNIEEKIDVVLDEIFD